MNYKEYLYEISIILVAIWEARIGKLKENESFPEYSKNMFEISWNIWGPILW